MYEFIDLSLLLHNEPSIIASIFPRYGFKIAARNGVKEKGAMK